MRSRIGFVHQDHRLVATHRVLGNVLAGRLGRWSFLRSLREILKDYRGQLRAALVDESDSAELQPRFRVLVAPSLALVNGGETLEVIPRVRDWADYARAFKRYLGNPAPTTKEAQ